MLKISELHAAVKAASFTMPERGKPESKVRFCWVKDRQDEQLVLDVYHEFTVEELRLFRAWLNEINLEL